MAKKNASRAASLTRGLARIGTGMVGVPEGPDQQLLRIEHLSRTREQDHRRVGADRPRVGHDQTVEVRDPVVAGELLTAPSVGRQPVVN